jgi:uroporphyrinogen-III decarboxylase
MKERIDIVLDEKEILQNDDKRERLKRAQCFQPVDRVPVTNGESMVPALAARRVTYREFYVNSKEHLRHNLLNYKWMLENMPDDKPINTRSVVVAARFGALRGVEFPMEIQWPENQPAKSIHPLTEPEQIDTLAIPDPYSGLNAKHINWFREMKEHAGDFDVRLNGQPLAVETMIGHSGGPIPSAFALAGANLFEWMYTEPERVHRLMDIVTESFINTVLYNDQVYGRSSDHPQGMGADTGEMLSPALFREFAVPYYLRVWERFPGPRGLHMCGQIAHLLPILRDELKITSLDGFGFPLDPDLLAREMAGRCVLAGGPSPMMIQQGPPETIIAECRRYIKTLAGSGGYILHPGGGPVPDTPREHYLAVIEASKRMGAVQ